MSKAYKDYIPFFLLLAVGLFIRVLAAQSDVSYENDLLTFQVWASELYANGLSQFYNSGFTDYPPLYMYVLYVLGMVGSHFNLSLLSPAYNLLTKLPAICCDGALAFFIYHVTLHRRVSAPDMGVMHEVLPCLLAAAYLINPAVILDSAVWGQVDSVYTFLLLAAVCFLSSKKLLPAYLLYGAAILTKPQSLFLGPVFLYSAFSYLQASHFNKRAVMRLGLYILAAVLNMAALAAPFTQNFDYMPILAQYMDTLGSYAYGSVNAYNFFALIGGNWAPLTQRFLGVSYTMWGTVFVVLIMLAGLAFLHWKRHDGNLYFLTSAALNVLVFMFSVKMHERYLYPALVFLLAAFALSRDKRLLGLYAAFSVTFFLNCADILRMIDNGNSLSVIQYTHPVLSLINVVIAVIMVVILCDKHADAPDRTRSDALTSDKSHLDTQSLDTAYSNISPPNAYLPRMERTDILMLLALITVYSIAAFFNLGETKAPQTVWAPKQGQLAVIDLGEVIELSRLQFMMGARHDKPFIVYASQDGRNWDFSYEIHEADVFAWTDIPMNISARYVEVIPFGDGLMLMEAAIRDARNELIPIISVTAEASALTDEQHLVPYSGNYMNGTYFDEIYHARTGYELAYGLEIYENTHPPLGKNLIALSIKLFGVTPFAWRLPGALFGLLMIPLIYAFSRQMFNSNKWALLAAFLLSFDFMHFTQTRIATIDTYVTFFVLAMYLCMYQYTRGVMYRSLLRSFALLALCGTCMGLAVASKWQGVYGAAGLPLLFFPSWYALLKVNKKDAYRTVIACVGFFIIVPVLIYGLSYIPFVKAMGGGIPTILDNQRHMFWYHSTLVSEHTFSSKWWEWPLMLRPIYYYANSVSEKLGQGISSFGNPAIWWFGIIAAGYALYSLWKKFDYNLVFLLIAYAAQYLPWVLVSRTTYIYHYFPSVPFVVLLIVCMLKKSATKRKIIIGYAVLTAALFVLFYPVLSGMPVSVRFVRMFLRWLPGWVLI